MVNSSTHNNVNMEWLNKNICNKGIQSFNIFVNVFRKMNPFNNYAYSKYLQMNYINTLRTQYPKTKFYTCHPGFCTGTDIIVKNGYVQMLNNIFFGLLQKSVNQCSWTIVF